MRPLRSLQAKAVRRKPGYLEACLKLGELDEKTGMVKFTPEAWLKIRQNFTLPARLSVSAVNIPFEREGMGDKFHNVLGPIGRAINWPCMKGDGTTNLKPGSPCDRLKAALNRF